MLKHNFKIILRNFKRFKRTFIINLIGLSTGLASALFLFLWITSELRVDKFHENDQRLFQVMGNVEREGRINTLANTGGGLGEALKRDMPEVEYAVTMIPPAWFQKFNILNGNNAVGAVGNFVSKDFFKAFSYRIVQGNTSGILNDKQAIVLSKRLAKKIFNTTDNVVGKVLQWRWLSFTKPCTVTGVYDDFPPESSYQFDFVLSLDAWKDIVPVTGDVSSGPFNTFLVLKDGTNTGRFNEKLAAYLKDKFSGSTTTLFLRKYSDAYLYGKYENGVQAGGKIEYVRLFAIIAIFILAIACINFMNLSTARAIRRMKEIGVKKALGAERHALIFQFLGESILMSFISLVVALILVAIFLPQFDEIIGKHIDVKIDMKFILSILGIAGFVGLVAGSYPAFYLSRFKIISVLKGTSDRSPGAIWVRKGLVAFQFAISIIFIVAAMVVYNQMKFVQSQQPGYDKDNVIYFEMEGRVAEQTESFLAELKNIPGVINASSIQQKIILPTTQPGPGVRWDGKNLDDKIRFYKMPVNYDLLETLGIKMAEGRSFSRSFGSDTAGVVLNEAAVKVMELTDPIGKQIDMDGVPRKILGIAKNFHFNSFHEGIKPFIFWLDPKGTALVMVKVKKGVETAAIHSIKDFYSKFNPGFSFDYKFLDEDYQRQYASERLVARLSKYFTGLAIIISCLGLFGLATFTVEKKVKEIGIRKVMGASESNIVFLLSADFTKTILLSIIIALPLSYILTSNWLNDFAYRIKLTPLYFIVAALLALLTAWFTIGVQVIKAARVNPLNCLKDE
ncbi:transporter permease [Chitinophaga caeni]|uniref:Transporter permease n=1 Tax=Chitinophaga caeni TaxID=2029983 RepID=A0A291QUW3_9BACT|nr:ABC transporter permease [Chitinophaga caeni]ATL47725.1 transporter permease [Chitinophaga caeni]